MTKMVICPKCGQYQEDTKAIRKVGVAAKKAGMYAGQFAMKFGAQAIASSVGLDGEMTQRAVGMAGTEMAKSMGLNPENASIDAVQYKCDYCKHYWDKHGDPTQFNHIQIGTVEEIKRAKCNGDKSGAFFSLILTAVASYFIWLSFDIWSERSIKEITNTFLGITTTSTDYSWHYYVFWPLIIFSCLFALIGVCFTISNYFEYRELKNMDYVEYAKTYMTLVDDSKPQS